MALKFDTILLVILIFQLFFIAIFLLRNKKGKRLTNRLLGLFFLMIAINLLDLFFAIHELYAYYIYIALADDGFMFAFGPLIFLYTKSVVYKDYKFQKKDLGHFLLFFVVTLFLLLTPLFNTKTAQLRLMDSVQQFDVPWVINMVLILMNFHALLYLFFSYSILRKYRNRMKELYATLEALDLNWLKFTLDSLLVVLIIGFFHHLIPVVYSGAFIRVSMVVFIVFLLYFSNRVILTAMNQSTFFEGIANPKFRKYEQSNLTQSDLAKYANQLEMYMQNAKPYLDPNISLKQMAAHLQLSPRLTSQIINQSFKQNFFDYINTYRINFSKQLLANSFDDKVTILEILYQSGFNSKSSFNTLFKKQTGLTPTEFRKQKNLHH